MNKSKRYPRIDWLYTIGIFLVLFGHSHSSDWGSFEGTILQSAIEFIYMFHMPLFFFIAGFLFINSKSIEKLGYVKWIKEKSIKLLTPYVVLSFAALIPKYYIEHHAFVTMKEVARAIFIPREGVWGHFWFIPVLLGCYALFGIWRKYVTEKNRYYMISAVTIVSLIIYFLPISIQWLGIKDIAASCIFFSIGMVVRIIGLQSKGIANGIKFLAGAISASLLFQFADRNKVILLIIALLMIYSCWQLAGFLGKSRVALWISKHNFTMYIYSWPFQAVMMAICGKIETSWYVTSLLMFLTGVFAPICFILLYEKFSKIHNKIFDLVFGVK